MQKPQVKAVIITVVTVVTERLPSLLGVCNLKQSATLGTWFSCTDINNFDRNGNKNT